MIIRQTTLGDVSHLFVRCHAYGSSGKVAKYVFAVYEDEQPIAAFAWQPPPFGAAASVCPEAPQGVLSLSRMVAVPKEERRMKKISRAIRRQRDDLIDRTRWPVLITYSDEGLEHTGACYRYSGFRPTSRRVSPQYVDDRGNRTSRYSNGSTSIAGLTKIGDAIIQRWEHWANVVPYRDVAEYMAAHGWRRVPVAGKRYRSGAPAFTWSQQTGDVG